MLEQAPRFLVVPPITLQPWWGHGGARAAERAHTGQATSPMGLPSATEQYVTTPRHQPCYLPPWAPPSSPYLLVLLDDAEGWRLHVVAPAAQPVAVP